MSAARKRAVGREGRYGGLLNKLAVEPMAANAMMVPWAAELGGATSWIMRVGPPPLLPDALSPHGAIAAALAPVKTAAKAMATLRNVVVMVDALLLSADAAADIAARWDALVGASGGGDAFWCMLLSFGDVYEGGDRGGVLHYHVCTLFVGNGGKSGIGNDARTTMPPPPPGRTAKLAYRLLAHSLALDFMSGMALAARENDADEVESLSRPIAEGEFALVTAGKGGDGVPPEDPYGYVKRRGGSSRP